MKFSALMNHKRTKQEKRTTDFTVDVTKAPKTDGFHFLLEWGHNFFGGGDSALLSVL